MKPKNRKRSEERGNKASSASNRPRSNRKLDLGQQVIHSPLLSSSYSCHRLPHALRIHTRDGKKVVVTFLSVVWKPLLLDRLADYWPELVTPTSRKRRWSRLAFLKPEFLSSAHAQTSRPRIGWTNGRME